MDHTSTQAGDVAAILRREGYVILPQLFSFEERRLLAGEVQTLVSRHYNQANLDRHSVYPADRSPNRESHAMMIAEAVGEFPQVSFDGCPAIARYLSWYNGMVAQLTGRPVAPSSRSMLNWQEYRSGSKPVGEHFDGEYLRADKIDGVEFTLREGLLPRYVAVLTVHNENNGRGIELIKDGRVIVLELHPGDVVLFDNVAVRHRVPEMKNPRTTIGLRNFDHRPLHFVRTQEDRTVGCHYAPIAEGFISEEVDCAERFRSFLRDEWPAQRASYGAYV